MLQVRRRNACRTSCESSKATQCCDTTIVVSHSFLFGRMIGGSVQERAEQHRWCTVASNLKRVPRQTCDLIGRRRPNLTTHGS